jgi:hypothetical protein
MMQQSWFETAQERLLTMRPKNGAPIVKRPTPLILRSPPSAGVSKDE